MGNLCYIYMICIWYVYDMYIRVCVCGWLCLLCICLHVNVALCSPTWLCALCACQRFTLAPAPVHHFDLSGSKSPLIDSEGKNWQGEWAIWVTTLVKCRNLRVNNELVYLDFVPFQWSQKHWTISALGGVMLSTFLGCSLEYSRWCSDLFRWDTRWLAGYFSTAGQTFDGLMLRITKNYRLVSLVACGLTFATQCGLGELKFPLPWSHSETSATSKPLVFHFRCHRTIFTKHIISISQDSSLSAKSPTSAASAILPRKVQVIRHSRHGRNIKTWWRRWRSSQ